MRLPARLLALASMFAACTVHRAEAQTTWTELRTKDFVLHGAASPGKLRPIACEIQQVFNAVGLARNGTNGHLPSILAVTTERGIRELLPQYWERRGPRPLGAYWSGLFGHHIAVRLDTSRQERQRRLLHETAHLATTLAHPAAPRWLQEGLSELWESADLREEFVQLGDPVRQHLKTLRSGKNWIPLSELTAADRVPETGRGTKAAAFYAQAWALVHFMLFEKGGGRLAVDRLFQASELPDDDQLRRYVRGGLAGAIRIALSSAPGGCSPGVERAVSPAEALVLKAQALADGERPEAGLPLLEQALRLDSDRVAALETLAFVHFRGNRPLTSAEIFDRLISSGRGSHVSYYYRSLLAAVAPLPSDPSGQAEVEYLRRALDLAPDFEPARERLRKLTGRY